MREIDGLGFENAPRVPMRTIPILPLIAPFVDHRYARSSILDEPTVALSLYVVVNMATGQAHVASRQALADRFRIPVNSTVILSGVNKDAPIESWWALKNRPEILAKLCELGIGVVTSPNYSVLTDVPRTDNLHAMKRILLTWTEMAAAGLSAALHVNSRTERDYQRWGDLIAERPEIQILAFEFATGGGRGERIDWHVEQLCKLADRVGRGLALVIRGGGRKLPTLRKHFAQVTLIETDAFYRAHRRRRAYLTEAGRLKWAKQLTPPGAAIDELLANNVAVVRAHFEIGPEQEPRLRPARRATNGNDEAAQSGFLRYFDLAGEAGGIPREPHHMIAATKT